MPYLYASFSLSRASMCSLVSCLYERKVPKTKEGFWGLILYALPVCLLEPLKGQDEQLGVRFVAEKSPQIKEGFGGLTILYLYASFSLSRARMSSLVSCLLKRKVPKTKEGFGGLTMPYLYASFSLSRARMSSLVSCL